MKFLIDILIKTTILIILFSIWFVNTDIFYDFLIFIIFGVLGIFFFIRLIYSLLVRRYLNDYLIPSICIAGYIFMLVAIDIANDIVLEEIERNKPTLKSCCHKAFCDEFDDTWIVKSDTIMSKNIEKWGANIKISYIRYKNLHDLRTDYFLSKNYFFRYECQSTMLEEDKC